MNILHSDYEDYEDFEENNMIKNSFLDKWKFSWTFPNISGKILYDKSIYYKFILLYNHNHFINTYEIYRQCKLFLPFVTKHLNILRRLDDADSYLKEEIKHYEDCLRNMEKTLLDSHSKFTNEKLACESEKQKFLKKNMILKEMFNKVLKYS